MPFWEGQQDLTTIQWLLRAFFVYSYLLILTKLMGQREIGQLTLFDFIVSITIGSVAAGGLNNSTGGLRGVITTIGALAILQIMLSFVSLKMSKLRRVFEDEPIILIQNGKLLEKAMRKTRYNLDDLMSQLRQKNFFYLHQVEFAVLEPSGKISVLAKSQYRPATPADLNINTQYEGYPSILIEDGNIINENLKLINLSEEWLMGELEKNYIQSPRDVLVAMLDTKGKLYFSLKNNASERTGSHGEPSMA
ncbi:DUF421 domain-containing protein [Desulfotomaculum defluvii]